MVVGEGMDGEQLNGGHAKTADVLHEGLVPEAGESAAQVLGDAGVQHGRAAHMGLVDEHALTRDAGEPQRRPLGAKVGDDPLRHEGRAVARLHGEVRVVAAVEIIAIDGRVPADVARQVLRIRVDQQLVRVEAVAALGAKGPWTR